MWKTRPKDFQLPMKHGLKQGFYIGTVGGCAPPDEWCLPDRWEIEKHWRP